MLVLSRKVGERIHVGDNITVEIRRIAGNRVTVALEAPRSVRILRGELEQVAHEFELHVDDMSEDESPRYASASTRIGVARELPPQTVRRDSFT